MIKIDLHNHSTNSDGVSSVNEIAREITKKGLQGFALTDHDTIKGHNELRDIKNLITIKGIEISTAKGHLTALGIQEDIPALLTVEETLEKIKEQGGVAVAVHPFDLDSRGIMHFKKYKFNAVEVLNGLCFDKTANSFAKKHSKGFAQTGGTDTHHYKFAGTAYTLFKNAQSEDEVLKEIKMKITKAGGRSLTPAEYVEQTLLTKDGKFEGHLKHSLKFKIGQKVVTNVPQSISTAFANKSFFLLKKYNYLRLKMHGF